MFYGGHPGTFKRRRMCESQQRVGANGRRREREPAPTVAGAPFPTAPDAESNAATLKRVDKVYCRNERALICVRLATNGDLLTLVAVGAVLVASVRLHFLGHEPLRAARPTVISCDAGFAKGQEMGWFEHGSTIIVIAPAGYALCAQVQTGVQIRMGERLLSLPHLSGMPADD